MKKTFALIITVLTILIGGISYADGDIPEYNPTLEHMNRSTEPERTFNFTSADEVYTTTENMGTTAPGTFTINGVIDDNGNKTTVDLNGHRGIYSIGQTAINNATININNVVFMNGKSTSDGVVIHTNNGDTYTVTIDNVDFINNIATVSGEHLNGGALTNYTDTFTKIIGNFIENGAVATGNNGAYGGGVCNWKASTTGDISGKYLRNYTSSTNTYSQGGAICNYGTVDGDITGYYEENFSSSTKSTPCGGAIYTSGTVTGSIEGQFISNYINQGKSPFGAAICNAGVINNSILGTFDGNYVYSQSSAVAGGAVASVGPDALIGNISADFLNNYVYSDSSSASGGAINNNNFSEITNGISGNFVGNYAKSAGDSSLTRGGAIFNLGYIKNITGNFTNNYGESSGAGVIGGSISNFYINEEKHGQIDTLSGTYSGNYALATGENSYAQGGAIYNTANIGEITESTFENNYALSENGSAQGGAIYIAGENAVVGNISADFTGNYTHGKETVTSGTTTDDSKGGAIYIGDNATVGNITGTFENNHSGKGGAIYIENGANVGTISGSFKNNYTSGYGTGGAIYADHIGNLTIGDNTLFENNSQEIYANIIDEFKAGDNLKIVRNSESSNRMIDIYFDNNLSSPEKDHFINTFEIGNNAEFSGGKCSAIGLERVRAINIGDDFYVHDTNKAIYATFDSSSNETNTFRLGNNATLKNLTSGNLIELFIAEDAQIGNNLKVENCTGTAILHTIWTGYEGKLTIGDNAQFINNKNGHLINQTGINSVSIGDNLVVKDNTNMNTLIYTNYYYGSTDNTDLQNIIIGDNAEISNNTAAGLIDASVAKTISFGENLNLTNNVFNNDAIYTDYVDKLIIGDNATITNNIFNDHFAELDFTGTGSLFKIGDNTIISNNTSSPQFIEANDLDRFEVGKDFSYTNNSGAQIELYMKGSDRIFSIDDNASISDNSNTAYGLIYVNGANKFTIGDNLTYTNNTGAQINSYMSGSDSIFSLGDNATLSDNEALNGQVLINVSSENKFSVGDNLKISDNSGFSNVVYTFMDGSNAEFTIGNNAEILGNKGTNNNYLFNISQVSKVDIGDDFKMNDNEEYIGILYTHWTGNDKTFTLGDNAEFSGNKYDNSNGGYRIISLDYADKVTIGDNFKMNDNIGFGGGLYNQMSNRTDNEFSLGNSAEFTGNYGTDSSSLIYSNYASKYSIGDDLSIKGNYSYNSILRCDLAGDATFSLGNNAEVSDNYGGSYNYELLKITTSNSVTSVKDVILGDNLKVNNNYDYKDVLYVRGTYSTNVKVGDKAEFTGNTVTPSDSSYNYINYIYSANNVTIGDDFKVDNNTGYSEALYVYGSNNAEVKVGDNAQFTNNTNPRVYGNLIDLTGSNKTIEFGDNLTVTGNYGNQMMNAYAYGEGSSVTIGNYATFSNNETPTQSGQVAYMSGNKVNIGDNFEMKENSGYSNDLYAYASGDNSEFTLGSDAEISGNTKLGNGGHNLYASANKITIGDNLKVNENLGSTYVTCLNGSGSNNSIIVGNNAEMCGNDASVPNGYVSYVYGNDVQIGDNLKMNDNKGYYYGIYSYMYGDDKEFTIGNNAEITGNTTENPGGYLTYISNANFVEFGENLTIKENKGHGYSIYSQNNKEVTVKSGADISDNENYFNLMNFSTNDKVTITEATISNNKTTIESDTATTVGGMILLNDVKEFNLVNSSVKDNTASTHGGGINVVKNSTVNIIADDGETVFKGNTDSTGANDVFVNKKANDDDPAVNVNLIARNNGYVEMNGTLERDTDTFNLNIDGDETGKVVLNNRVINGESKLENTTLILGVTNPDEKQSDVLAHEGTTMNAVSGTIDFQDDDIVDYNVNKLTSSNTKYKIDVDWVNETGDRIVLVDKSSSGEVKLGSIKALNILDQVKEKVIVQVIKGADGDETDSPIQLSLALLDQNPADLKPYVPEVFSDTVLAGMSDEITLETTDTLNDSIGLRGYILNTLEYIAQLETKNGDKKKFTFTEGTPVYEYDGNEITVIGDLTFEGTDKENNKLDFKGTTTFKTDENSKVTFNNSSIKDSNGVVNNGELVLNSSNIEGEVTNNGKTTLTDATLKDDLTNNGEVVLTGATSKLKSVDGQGGKLTYQDGTHTMDFSIKNQSIVNEGANTTLSDLSLVNNNGNSLSMNGGALNIPNMGLTNLHFTDFAMNGGTINIGKVSVDLANEKMGRITADRYSGEGTGTVNVNSMVLTSDGKGNKTYVPFADGSFKNTVKTNVKKASTKLYDYTVAYDASGSDGKFVFTKGIPGSPVGPFNPNVVSTAVNVNTGACLAMNNTFTYVFEHADAFTQFPKAERYAMIKENQYALSTPFNNNLNNADYSNKNRAYWVRPFATFENTHLKHGPKVDIISYGTLAGYDTPMKEYKNGWVGVGTAYLGYNGSQLSWGGMDTSMNGGLLGFTETLYKGNFWTALTVSAGASAGDTSNDFGHENFATLMAGVANKTGYNFEFKQGKFIVQPVLQTSYTFVNTFDYKTSNGVKITDGTGHYIQLHPSVRFIGNLKHGWQIYAQAGLVWDVMNLNDTKAAGVRLPNMYVKPYAEYGLGLQRHWGDRFIAFGQAMVRSGGRNGVALTFGFRWALGK